ncbi:MAG: hypothetical protein RL757_2730 [Bacteroidota bacterium]|jgi:hypothetical protein
MNLLQPFFQPFSKSLTQSRKKIFAICLLSAVLFQNCGRNSVTTSASGFNTVATPRRNFLKGDKMDVILFDVRSDKHQGLGLERTFQQHLAKSYPSAWVRTRDSDAFFRKSNNNVVTVRVRVEEFDVTQRVVVPQVFSQKTPNAGATTAEPQNELEKSKTVRANAIMVLIVSIDDLRSGRTLRNSTETRELFPVEVREDGGYSTNGMGIVLQKSLDRLCGFIDANLR